MSKKLIYLISFTLLLGLAFSSTASAVVIDPNLVGWWKLNETVIASDALVYDWSGHGLHGYFRGLGPIQATQANDRYGVPNYAKAFNFGTVQGNWVKNVGTTSSAATWPITDPNNVRLSPREQITMSLWMKGKRNLGIGETWEGFLCKGDNSYRISRSAAGNTPHCGLNGTSLGWFDGTKDINDGYWHHIAGVYDGNQALKAALYIDGVLDVSITCSGVINATTDLLFFAANPAESNRQIQATLDNIRIYNRAVKQTELVYLMEEYYPYAYDPAPANGAVTSTTTPTLKWRSGDDANTTTTSPGHKLYLDPDQAKVIARNPSCLINVSVSDTNALDANEPNYPITTPLAMLTTYYWVVDEVNVGTTGSPWKGVGGDDTKTWSFYVPGYKAVNPDPNHGNQLVYNHGYPDPCDLAPLLDITLYWSPGIGATNHYVYLSTDPLALGDAIAYIDVNTFNPAGVMNYGTTYYWRIDEYNEAIGLTQGDVWSFTAIGTDVGLKGEYYNNADLYGLPVYNRKDLNIGFDWGYGTPHAVEPCVPADMFSVRWTAEMNVPETGTYTFSTFALGEDGMRVYLNEQLVPELNGWPTNTNPASRVANNVNLVKGMVPVRVEFRETSWGASCKLFWKTPSMTGQEIIPIGKYYLPIRASSPSPANGATTVRRDPNLIWRPGVYAVTHDVYLDTNETKVTDANRAVHPILYYSQNQDPCYAKPGNLAFNTTYYWRIDEVSAGGSPIFKGNIWHFKTGNYLVVDSFESYNLSLASVWKRGGTADANATLAIDPNNPVHTDTSNPGSKQAMTIDYNNASSPYYSEAYANPTSLEIADVNWVKEGVKSLGLWFRGYTNYKGSATISADPSPYTATMTAGSVDSAFESGDIQGTSDTFHFAYKRIPSPYPTDNYTQIMAKVLSVEDTAQWAKAGVMIRETLKTDSNNASVIVTPDGAVSFQRRSHRSGINDDTGSYTSTTTLTDLTLPRWVRLRISADGKTIYAYHADGTLPAPGTNDWIKIGNDANAPFTALANAPIGLCVTSNDTTELCTATFSDVKLESSSPTLIPGSWSDQDIGIPYNDFVPMYVMLQDSDSNGIVYHSDPNVTRISNWTEWRIDLNDFKLQGVDINNVQKIYIGLGDPCNPSAGGLGKMHIDDIRLYRPEFVAGKLLRIPGDVNYDGDINYKDIVVIADNWLRSAGWAVTPNGVNDDNTVNLIGWWKLDGNYNDSSFHGNTGTVPTGTHPTWAAGKVGPNSLDIDGWKDYVDCNNSASLNITDKITLAMWVNTTDAQNGQDNEYLSKGTQYGMRHGIGNNDANSIEFFITDAGTTYKTTYPVTSSFNNVWHHLAGTYDGNQVKLYVDGNSVAITAHKGAITSSSSRVNIGTRDGTNLYYEGLIDDVRIYNRVLSQNEVAYLADQSAFTQRVWPLLRPSDPNTDPYVDPNEVINFRDFAVIGNIWLQQTQVWPTW